MEELGFGPNDNSATCDQEQKKRPQESSILSIHRYIGYLVHACQCNDANCSVPSCQKVKRVVQHEKSCKQKTNGGCPICKHLFALCSYHAKQCQEPECPVPFCANINDKLRQKQLQKKLEQAQILKRRIATMKNSGVYRASPQSSPVQRLTKYLTHAYECRHTNCGFPSCLKMKRLIQRAKNCKQKGDGSCNICKYLDKLLPGHCQEAECSVPSRTSIKRN